MRQLHERLVLNDKGVKDERIAKPEMERPAAKIKKPQNHKKANK